VIPIAIILARQQRRGRRRLERLLGSLRHAGVGVLFVPTALMIIFRKKYRVWWYDWNLELLRFRQSRRRLLAVDGRPLPLHRRAAGRTPRLPYPEVERDLEAGCDRQVASGHPHYSSSSSSTSASSSP